MYDCQTARQNVNLYDVADVGPHHTGFKSKQWLTSHENKLSYANAASCEMSCGQTSVHSDVYACARLSFIGEDLEHGP